MFSRFQSIVNKISANRSADAFDYTEHEKALKLLYALDRSVWDLKVNTCQLKEVLFAKAWYHLFGRILESIDLVRLGIAATLLAR